ncbi:MAG: glycosyltransferase family A protein, partial [Candidatus Acidiferrales bacterium]
TVSVVIPAYNAGRLIDAAIRSVLSQEWAPDEIIIVNDGSTDRDYSELQRLHKSIRVVTQPNRGLPAAARNLGFSAATGDYIATLDADDVWLPGKLHAQMLHLVQNPDIDAAFCKGLRWMQDTPEATPPEVTSESSMAKAVHLHYADFLCSLAVAPSTMVIKKSAWKSIGGFNESVRYGEDHDFYLRLSYGHRIDLLEFFGALYRHHRRSMTAVIQERNHWADVRENAVRTLGTTDMFGNRADPEKIAKHSAFIHFQHGHTHFWVGSFRVAREQFLRVVKLTPGNYKGWAYLLLSSLPGLRSLTRLMRRPSPDEFDGSTRPM